MNAIEFDNHVKKSLGELDAAIAGLREWHSAARDLIHPPVPNRFDVLSEYPRLTDGTSTGWTLPHAEGCPGAPGELWAIALEGDRSFQVMHAEIIKVRHPNGRVFLGRYLPDNSIQLFSHLQQF